MERREQYDPEDIESLLAERGFDELLAEERAFVLRHLSGRDEYEQMRALLHFVRPDERNRPTIEPEDRVRANVLAAFRAQQQPQWRVWLNSISAWLVPGDLFAFWRPALVFGSLALLIVAGVVAVRQFSREDGTARLAEVKQDTTLQDGKTAGGPTVPQGTMDTIGANGTVSIEAATEASHGTASASNGGTAEEPPPAMLDIATADTRSVEELDVNAADDAQPVQGREDLAAAVAKEEQKDLSFAPAATVAATTVSGATPTLSHVVTQDELVRNESVANVSVVRKAGKTKKRAAESAEDDGISASRSLGQDPALMGLINSGW
ncbi:MAG TPA: hypothetical protein PLB89_08860 [Flavobacteriales bacterium]|nr:hypothetical protein [Flavobacteriales bacterium]